MSSLHRITRGCILPWCYVSPLEMVHKKSMSAYTRAPFSFMLTFSKELGFRSAILYGGLLISNAFGSVSDFIQYSLCTHEILVVDGCGDSVWNGRKERHTRMEMVRDPALFMSCLTILCLQGCSSSK